MRDKRTFFITLFLIISLILTVMTVMASAEAKSKVTARAAALYLPERDIFLFEKMEDERLPMASTTKIMTALVTIENADLDDTVTVTEESVGIEGSSLYLKAGDTVTVEDLIYALMLRSANDAASALAIHVSGDIDSFSELMNNKAKSLGLTDTSFRNPHGLDSDGHYTTAHDLAIIAAEAMKSPTLREITSTYKRTVYVSGSERTVVNHNKLLRSYEGAVGVKTGFTKRSGRCLVSAAERDGVLMIAVTLDAPNDWKDHTSLLDLGFSSINTIHLSDLCDIRLSLPASGVFAEKVSVSAKDMTLITLAGEELTIKYDIPECIPIGAKKGDTVGKINVYKNGKIYKEIDLTLDQSVMLINISKFKSQAS